MTVNFPQQSLTTKLRKSNWWTSLIRIIVAKPQKVYLMRLIYQLCTKKKLLIGTSKDILSVGLSKLVPTTSMILWTFKLYRDYTNNQKLFTFPLTTGEELSIQQDNMNKSRNLPTMSLRSRFSRNTTFKSLTTTEKMSSS